MSTLKVNTIQPVSGTPSITSSEIATLSRDYVGKFFSNLDKCSFF
jgi:hypothetical protein